jgi:four helix bundle protein
MESLTASEEQMPRSYQGDKTCTYRKLYGYKKLITWQKANDLAAMVHDLTLRFGPGHYRLSDQMRGSSQSVKDNIAEGYCRVSLGDYIRFCEIARGSLGELGSQIQSCERWGLAIGDELTALLEQYGDTSILSIIRGENCAPYHTLSRTDLIDKPCRVW